MVPGERFIRACHRRLRCRGPAQVSMINRYRRTERCGAGQISQITRHRTRTSWSRGPSSWLLSGNFPFGSTPLLRRRVCSTGRLFNCQRCRKQVVICTACDRGQRYCSRSCSNQSRVENCRAARRRYARTPRGRLSSRVRQRRHRLVEAERARAVRRAETEAGSEHRRIESPSSRDDRIDTLARAAPVAAIAAGVDGPAAITGAEKTVTDHSSAPPKRPLMTRFAAPAGRSPPLRCVRCGQICSHVVLRDP